MPCLLYCVTDSTARKSPPSSGVGGATVESVEIGVLRCYYLPVDSLASDAESLKRAALHFHGVTQSLFEQTTIIPFRFPTILSSLAELDAYLQRRLPAYDAALKNIRDTAQMEIRIALAETDTPHVSSGTGYLQTRAQHARQLEQAISSCRVAINEEVIDWRQRESLQGVRCFVLVRREAVKRVQQQLQQVRLERVITAAVSGPWPATEFLPDFA